MHCRALILSKKGFGEGSLVLTLLDRERGKIKALSFGGALETGSRRAALISGNLIEGLLQPADGLSRLTEAVVISSYEGIRSSLKGMAYFLTAMELFDGLLPEELPVESFPFLIKSLDLFHSSEDEKFLLFYMMRFLAEEGWLGESPNLSPPALRFYQDACAHSPDFLHGKNISEAKKRELLTLIEDTARKITGKRLKSLELLPPEP